LRTASAGPLPLLEPLLEREPFERCDFGFAVFDFGLAAFLAAFGLVDFDGDFPFDCGFDLVDDPALFGADRFCDLALV
jgi:hypothetical protein